VPILEPVSGLFVLFWSKQGSAEVPPVCSESCFSALETGQLPDPSWEFLLSS